MDLPLNSFNSDDSGGVARPEIAPSTGAAGFVGDSTAFSEWAFVWRRPPRAGRAIGIDPLRLIAIAALTSAAVSLLTIWISGGAQVRVPGNEWVPVVTVSYEPLEPESTAPAVAAAGSPAAPISETANEEARPVPRGTTEPAPTGFFVTSLPEGASVTINGVGYGITPLTVRFLPPGAKRIRATKPGYQSEERFLGAEAAGSTTRLRIVLREISGERSPQ
jgi:hypothetical protein